MPNTSVYLRPVKDPERGWYIACVSSEGSVHLQEWPGNRLQLVNRDAPVKYWPTLEEAQEALDKFVEPYRIIKCYVVTVPWCDILMGSSELKLFGRED